MFETTNAKFNDMTKKQVLAAAGYVGKPGRKKTIAEPASAHNIMIEDRVWDAIPEPKPDNVRRGLKKMFLP